MASATLVGLTAVWLLVIVALVTDWRGLRSRRPYAYPLLAVGGVLSVVREWTAALWTLDPTADLTLALGSNLAFLGVLVLFAWRWWGFRDGPD
jgi:hypothetical protein